MDKKKELDASGYVLDMAGVEIPLRSVECDGDIEDIKDLAGKDLGVGYMEIRRINAGEGQEEKYDRSG